MALIEAGKKEGAGLKTGGLKHGSEGYFIDHLMIAVKNKKTEIYRVRTAGLDGCFAHPK